MDCGLACLRMVAQYHGMMLAISYLLGQLNGPVSQLIGFIQDYQDAQISLERLGEIHHQRDEEGQRRHLMTELPESHDLNLEKVSFRYGGPESPRVLRDLDLIIPEGKTTLVKLLLKFYEPTEGGIFVSRTPLNQLRNDAWRAQCGVVMQDGYIFSDTIAFNIALEAHPDRAKLLRAVQVANIQDYIESLPLGYNTKIGREGVGLSAGQRQRLLIARAVYKDPAFLFFDEATNALDANNELTIMCNLEDFLRQRTVVVAHRLSTVKHADQIIVLENGQIIEQGKHAQLIEQQGSYFQLVSNQLELGQ